MLRTPKSSAAVAFAILGGVLAVGFAASAMAESHWAKDHPRRHQVNERLANQNRRIHNEVKEGEMSKAQARKLHKEDRQIRQEERDMASQNGGHITKQEQRVLNQQENAVSKQIGR
jgi:CRISPR/Cas system Type II protein with McrA/HNH and RuvC-like nuclease domain